MSYAVISSDTQVVVDSVLWDGVSDWSPPDGTFAVVAPPGVGVGWTYSDGVFSAPSPAPPPPPTIQALCQAVDRERDRRLALDFVYDFGTTPAVNDAGDVIEAGTRVLQMDPANRMDWQTVHGLALAARVSGSPNAVIPMRAEDNWNIQTPALQVLACLAAAALRGSALVFHGGALKSAIRSAEDPTSVDINAGWPS